MIPEVEEYDFTNSEYASFFSIKLPTSGGTIWTIISPSGCRVTKMKTNAWITYVVGASDADAAYNNLGINDEEDFSFSMLDKAGNVVFTADKFRMEGVSKLKREIEFHGSVLNINYHKPAVTVQPVNNQGRGVCFVCGTKTKKIQGVTFRSVYDVCPKCLI